MAYSIVKVLFVCALVLDGAVCRSIATTGGTAVAQPIEKPPSDTVLKRVVGERLAYPMRRALEKAGGNWPEIWRAIKSAPNDEERNGAVFLVLYMPERDLLTLSSELVLHNVAVAYKARHQFIWAKAVPDDVFLNDVLPYAVLNERRDDWRGDFYKRFLPIVKHCKCMRDAIKAVNRDAPKVLGVKYSVKRERADQSPYQSISSGMASCTGLSILLVDAFRSVGIPARIAGAPQWTSMAGNHTWVEVYVDGGWHFTEYNPDAKGLDHGWLLKYAAEASDDWLHRIYATSYTPTEYVFPLPWDLSIRYVSAIDVSQRYKALAKAQRLMKTEVSTPVRRVLILVFDHRGGKRVATEITVKSGDKMVASGVTSGVGDDMNHNFETRLSLGKQYTLSLDIGGRIRHFDFCVAKGDGSQIVQVYADELN